MEGIMKVNSTGYDRYEELLLRKNELKKECFLLEQEYTRVFGEDILAVFQAKIECVKKEKTIEFCQRAVNRGVDPDSAELQAFVSQETKELREHFRKVTEDYEISKGDGRVTEAELTEIRKIYRRLAKSLHPDLHPEVKESDKLQELWLQVSTAYSCNDLKELKELEVLAVGALAEADGTQREIEIPDIGEKTAALEKEIDKIMVTDPWCFQFLLDDPDAVKERKRSYRAELRNYREHSAQLDRILADLLPEGSVIIWD